MHFERAVYFRREDYASFWRRLLIVIIDATVFLILCVAAALPLAMSEPSAHSWRMPSRLIYAGIAVFYFVILKRSPFRTIGYLIGGVRIVGMDGQTPSYTAMLLRLMFGMLSPLWCFDLIWLFNDVHRQALRDKFACTYVVKRNAQPLGQGPVVFSSYEILYYQCLFREVVAEPISPA